MTTLGPPSLPCGWGRPPVYARFEVKLGKMLDEKRFTGDHSAPYLRNVDVQWDRINTDSLPVMDFSEDERERYSLREGDLLVCEGGEVGRTAIWRNQLPVCFFQKALHRLRPTTEHDDPRYFFWVMRFAFDFELFSTGEASTIQHLPAEALRKVRYPAPPLPRQRAIAAYLDRETAKIDAMIAAKERLLALLAEKRRALITHAVTRGLNEGVSMKDSGVEWLGQIPEHWDAAPLRYLVDITSGSTPDKGNAEYWGGDIPWVSPKDMKRDRIGDAEDHVTDLAMCETTLARIPAGSVLVVIRGMILAHSFPTAVTTAEVTMNQDMKALRCRSLIDPEFLWAYFRGIEKHIVSQADQSAHGTKKIDTEILGALSVVLPSLEEQRHIVQEVIKQTARVDELVGQTQRSIDLGRERRSALIAAAVTGQIDVEDAA